MQVQIQKWGNSLAIRIPRSFAKEVNIHQGSYVDLSIVKGKLIAEPIENEYSLHQLLSHVTNENIHKEMDTGKPVGKEVV
jgi:antitoxin MazE